MESSNPAIFVDTSFFKALIDLKDDFHTDAVKLWEQFQKNPVRLITSNFILDEAFTLIRVRCGLELVKEFRRRLAFGSTRMRIIRVAVADEADAWNWFSKNWEGLSFTDCVSFALMQRLGLYRAATFDQHFKKAGMIIESV